MSSYQEQAQAEMWDAIASQDRYRAEREHWQAVTAGGIPERRYYRPMAAKFAGKCDGCSNRVRRGQPILYTSNAPTGAKVFHEGCFPKAAGEKVA